MFIHYLFPFICEKLRRVVKTSKPFILMEDFNYDEEIDEPRDVRKAKLAFKEEAAKAKNHLENASINFSLLNVE